MSKHFQTKGSNAEDENAVCVQLPYHGPNTALVSTHDVRLPKESTVGDLLDAVMQQLPADKRPKDLRLLEIFNGKIYQVMPRARMLNVLGLVTVIHPLC